MCHDPVTAWQNLMFQKPEIIPKIYLPLLLTFRFAISPITNEVAATEAHIHKG